MLLLAWTPLILNSAPSFAASMTEGTGLSSKMCLRYKMRMVVTVKVKGDDTCQALGTGLDVQ